MSVPRGAGVLLFMAVALVWSQPKPTEEAEFDRQIKQERIELERQEVRLKLAEHRMKLAEKQAKLKYRAEAMKKKPLKAHGKKGRGFLKDHPRKRLVLLFGTKILAISVLLCATLHILLTILVFSDMRKRGNVVGLWVPVVLIGGLLAVIAYGLFRHGDAAAGS